MQRITLDSLTGENGLLVAVIAQAVRDLGHPSYRQSARRYFDGDTYKKHLQMLDLPAEQTPLALSAN